MVCDGPSHGHTRMTLARPPDRAPLDGAALHDIPKLLRDQWTGFAASEAVVLRWIVTADEVEWVRTFLDSLIESTSVLLARAPFEVPSGHGFELGRTLLPTIAATRAVGTEPFVPAIPRGLSDTEALARLLVTFACHPAASAMDCVVLVLDPVHVIDERAWHAWMLTFVRLVATARRRVRLLLLDSAVGLRYERVAADLGPLLRTSVASLDLPARITAATVARADLGRVEGVLRVMTVRTMQAVNERRIDDAVRLAAEADEVAHRSGAFAFAVPIRFSVGNGLAAAGRHVEAVEQFRAAELAAERAEDAGDANGVRLRILARFGVGAMLLSAHEGAIHAARYYEATAPLCARLGDARLELECHRVASLAHERSGNVRAAWDRGVCALALVDRLSVDERASAMLVPLADALVALTRHRSHRTFRAGLDEQLRRRGMKTSTAS